MINMADSAALVSIGMPVYNEERFIRQALDSLLSQSFEDFELIISDNASTDHTGDICLEYAAKDQRIRYYRSETNLGSIVNSNRTFRLSNAEYFFWASGHDLRDESFISRCLGVLNHDASVVLCYPIAKWLQYDGRLGEVIHSHIDTRGLGRFSKFNTVLWGLQYAYPIYGIIRSSALKKTGFLRNTIGADIVLLTELSYCGAFAKVPETLLHIRRLDDKGNWKQYYSKAFGSGSAMPSSLYLFCRLLDQFIRVIGKHGGSSTEKLGYFLAVMFCMLTKYRSYLYKLR